MIDAVAVFRCSGGDYRVIEYGADAYIDVSAEASGCTYVSTVIVDRPAGVEWVAENPGAVTQSVGLGFLVVLLPVAAVFGARRIIGMLR